MTDSLRDARLDELAFLSSLARAEWQGWTPAQFPQDTPKRRMVVQLLLDGCLNDAGSVPWMYTDTSREGVLKVADEIQRRKLEALAYLLSGQTTAITIGHKGRVRIAELAQQIATGRQRDPTGTVWSKRHMMTDLEVAIRRSTTASPAAFAIFDMNGLKAINDAGGHDAGDRAIRTYLQTIAAALPTGFDAYRGDGSDEVFVVVQAGLAASAEATLVHALEQLGREVIAESRGLRAACGLAVAGGPDADPSDVFNSTDKAMYRAKARSKEPPGGHSAVAVGEAELRLRPRARMTS